MAGHWRLGPAHTPECSSLEMDRVVHLSLATSFACVACRGLGLALMLQIRCRGAEADIRTQDPRMTCWREFAEEERIDEA